MRLQGCQPLYGEVNIRFYTIRCPHDDIWPTTYMFTMQRNSERRSIYPDHWEVSLSRTKISSDDHHARAEDVVAYHWKLREVSHSFPRPPGCWIFHPATLFQSVGNARSPGLVALRSSTRTSMVKCASAPNAMGLVV